MALLAAGLTASGASSFDRGEGAAPPVAHRSAGMQLKVLTSSDSAALSAGTVAVRADSSSSGGRQVTFTTTGFADGPLLTIPKVVTVRPGANSFELRLGAKGREVLDGCGATKLIVTASDAYSQTRLAQAAVSLHRTVPQCAELANASRCETIAAPGTNCLFPWPSDHFTVSDPSTTCLAATSRNPPGTGSSSATSRCLRRSARSRASSSSTSNGFPR